MEDSLQRGVMGVFTGLTSTLSRCSFTQQVSAKNLPASMGSPGAHLFAGLRIQQDPPQLNDLGGVLGHVHAMLVTRRSYVNDNVAVQIAPLRRIGSHGFVHAGPEATDEVAMGSNGGTR